jgi:hypothetical protein
LREENPADFQGIDLLREKESVDSFFLLELTI